ncbi:MAG: LPS assembly protein LptD [Rhodospirillales bacterium]|jgi:LPS-assembly protein|nr:LPS assembly protein LptD [Rhodospirillales bacterium]MDP6643402.1 LPS assembly protein LptD [Rhodospirillales bacterium]
MKRTLKYLLAWVALVMAVVSSGGANAQNLDTAQPLLFTADKLTHDRELGVVTASGNVEISQKERILLADTVSYSERQNIVTASGNVTLLEPSGDVLFAEHMELTGDFKDGTIRGLRIRLSDNARIAASGARRSRGVRTEMRNAVYSPCDKCASETGDPLLWQLKAVKVVHDQEKKVIEYRDAWMEFAGIPVAYTPYFSHPDPTVKRKTGFLTPRLGGSTTLGTSITTPYYIALAPNRDITITPTLTTKERLLLEGEYRELQRDQRFDARGSATYDSDNEFRGHINTSIRHDVNDSWRWGADIKRSTDDTYLRRYRLGSQNSLNTRLFAEAFRGRDYASADSYLYQGLRVSDDPGTTPIVFPMLELNHVGEPGKYGVNTSLDASLLALTRTHGTDTRRLSIKGGIGMPYFGPLGDVIELSATLRGDLYHYASHPIEGEAGGYDTGFEGRVYPLLTAGWRLPLSRRHGSSITEIMEPAVAVFVSPNMGNSSTIPNEDSIEQEFDETNLFSPNKFTGLDRVEGGTRISYGLRWGAYGAKGGSTSFFIGQRYRFRRDDSFPDASGLEDDFSDLVARVRIRPDKNLSLAYKTRIDKNDLSPRRTELNLAAGPPALNLRTNYVFFDRQEGSEFGGREEIQGQISTKLNRLWRAGFASRYNLEGEGELRSLGLNFTYECECFVFNVSLRREFYEDRDLKPNDSILFRLTFKTLGDIQTGVSRSGN